MCWIRRWKCVTSCLEGEGRKIWFTEDYNLKLWGPSDDVPGDSSY